ncbi:MAG TPA: hypothetical protein PKV16_07640 [Caldisericia bacterium]|nr:hypothetical protein [Caldisericia bacterium]HPF49703.1 hypothetical protein [Caldisericia bacterium]HPI84524.1 hypothetical protein [Caldisericia bacterium]HPQ93639.1 hypothetical protein [Caldisericia bacterium]HRV74797.1 hypothetical protein [Caldisericia bacterium]
MLSKCFEFTANAFRNRGSELSMVVLVSVLVTLLFPSITYIIWRGDPFCVEVSPSAKVSQQFAQSIQNRDFAAAHELADENSVDVGKVFKDLYLAEKLWDTLYSMEYDGGIYFWVPLDMSVMYVLKVIGRWILIYSIWFLLLLPYLLCGMANVFLDESETDNDRIAKFFSIKFSQYIRMAGAILIFSIRTFIACVFLFALVYLASAFAFGELNIWLLLGVGYWTLIYRQTRFSLVPFFIVSSEFSSGRCLDRGWNSSRGNFWNLVIFSIFPASVGFAAMLLFGHTFSIAILLFPLSLMFFMLLSTPIAKEAIAKQK